LKSFCKDKSPQTLLILATCLFFHGPLQAQSLPAFSEHFKSSAIGSVQRKESENFSVEWVHPRDAVIADDALRYLEAARSSLEVPFAQALLGDSAKAPVEIYPDLRSFSAVSGLSLARFRATGTIALTLDQRLMILSPRNLATGYSWAETLVHEYIHYLIRRISLHFVPIWLHEGTAQLYQGYPLVKEPELRPSQWGLFKKRRESGDLLSYQTLQEPFPMRATPEEAELAYVQAFLFTRWLDRQCGVVSLIREAEARKSLGSALQICSGRPAEQLEKEFLTQIMGSIEIPKTREVDFYALDFSGGDPLEVEGKRLRQESRNFAQISSELFGQGRYRASAIEMEKALSDLPAGPPSWRRHLALSYSRIEEDKRAQEVLRQVLADYPTDAASWFLLGQQYSAAAKWPQAWNAFLRTFYTNPFLDGLEEARQRVLESQPDLANQFLPSVR